MVKRLKALEAVFLNMHRSVVWDSFWQINKRENHIEETRNPCR